ncbi:unnamed protein product [Parnassius apollo]|uniref:(apollo) hypothetical protein n=1 Tax=Parnassius apollo TaxID=110799 RepID=A0A8S3Y901_PARAO|nr:unnamed protein product [Parnassius apollo]
MSKQLYNNTSQVVYDWFHKPADQVMREVGKEEARHEKEIGSVDSDGNPMITFRKKFRAASKVNDPDYGAYAQRPDMSEEVFEVAKQHFLKQLEVNIEERDNIQKNTLQQSHSQDWIEQRKRD